MQSQHSRIYSRTKKLKYNFGALSGTLFIYFVIFCLSIDTIFILGDLLTRLLLCWYLLLLRLENLHLCFLGPGFSWAEPREGCRAGFEPGSAWRTNYRSPAHKL
jgi:hypothetical protein